MRFSKSIYLALLFLCVSTISEGRSENIRAYKATFSGCSGVENPVSFTGSATNYIPILPHVLVPLGFKWNGSDYKPAKGLNAHYKSGIIAAPKHGVIKLDDAVNHLYWYEANPGYMGNDKVSFWVKISGNLYKLNLIIDVVRNTDFDTVCGKVPNPRD